MIQKILNGTMSIKDLVTMNQRKINEALDLPWK